jgi:hypothetical protein
MKVHWKRKWLEIPYGDQLITLQGVLPAFPDEVVVQLCVLSPTGEHFSSVTLPSEGIQ